MERCWLNRLQIAPLSIAFATILVLSPCASGLAGAQAVTTAALHGTVHAENGAPVVEAFVRVLNLATGYGTESRVRAGKFLVQGLPIGGPYRVTVRSLGYAPQIVSGISIGLGEERQINFNLAPTSEQLDTIRVTATQTDLDIRSGGGVGTSFSDSALRRLPTMNRDMYDFVKLVPQAGTRLGLTGGGANFRFNNYVIDGVSDRQLQGNNVMGPGTTGGKTISLEAVKGYQVLLSPYNARYGDFAGMLVNAVTKSGTNDFRGSAYSYMRDERLARSSSFVGSSPYRRDQYGFSLGGPIIRDRLHFFVAPEFQRSTAPAPGPYFGQSADIVPGLPVSADDVTRFASILKSKGIDAGDGGRVMSLNPALTLFARIDLSIPEWKSRIELRDNYSSVDVTRFARSEGGSVFQLSSNSWTLRTSKHTPALQIFTQLSDAVFNEMTFAYMDRPGVANGYAVFPSIQGRVVPPSGVGFVDLIAGPPAPAGGAANTQVLYEAADHVSFHAGSHTIGIGVHAELFNYHAEGVRNRYGLWRFASLDALANDDAFSYSITKDFGTAGAAVRGALPSAYVGDEWQIRERLSVTVGLRADAMKFFEHGTYNIAVDSIFDRRTTDFPVTRVQWSPRFGFSWEPKQDHRTRIAGGAGIFVGPPPLGWLLGPLRSNGAGVRTLLCSGPVGSGRVPKFVPDPARQPGLCPDGRGFVDGPVALVDRNLKMAESFRSSLSVERQLGWNVNASVNALYSRVRSDFVFINADLRGPVGVDAKGREMYGTIDATGKGHPALFSGGRFPEVIDLRNHSLGHSWSVTGQIEKPFSDRLEMRGAYTRSSTRDLVSITNGAAAAPYDNWAGSRPLSGDQRNFSTGISSFEIPHRVVLSASYAAPWRRWKTDVSLYYIGESGSPFTYGDSTAQGLGDLNADSTSANDPIYVPRNARDRSEIVFAGADSVAQATAFEDFIRRTPCLSSQRGRIVARNSCRSPWVNTSNASIRQSLQAIRGHDLSVQLEVFNLLNLLNPSWGLFEVPRNNGSILQHVGQTTGSAPQPIFRFDSANAGTTTRNLESGYQLQLSLRYTF